MDFFDRVKELAKKKGTTIEAVLESAGNISLNTYNGWKKRNIVPRADLCCLIASQLGVTVEFLVSGTDSSQYPPEIKEIIDACLTATHDQIKAIQLILRLNEPNHGKNLEQSAYA